MQSRSLQSRSSEHTLWLSLAVLVVAVIGGGGQGGLGDMFAQLLAICLLGRLGWLAAENRLVWHAPAWVRWLPVLAVALPVLQMLPIPQTWWASAPARAELAAQLNLVGVKPIPVTTLNVIGTERALWWMLPAIALFLATLATPARGRQALVVAIVLLAAANTLLGMAQLAQGPDSALRFYTPTNAENAVGFFANRNHLASLLAVSLPLALAGVAAALQARAEGRGDSVISIVAGCGAVILLFVGIALTKSRAGIVLGMLALFATFPLVMSLAKLRGSRRVFAATLGIALLVTVQVALIGVLQRMDNDPLDDARWTYASTTLEAARGYAPLGSGLGTFRQAYQPYEAKRTPDHVIVNHAHNDYIELWLEGGVPALLLLAAGLSVWALRGVQLCGRGEYGVPASQTRFWNRVAWLSATLILLHSALDYPLRTTAAMSVFAILVALAFARSDRTVSARGRETSDRGRGEGRVAE